MNFSYIKYVLLIFFINITLISCKKTYSKVVKVQEPALAANHTPQKEISLLFIGDIMQHGPQIRAAYNDSLKTYDYTSCFAAIAPIAKATDFTIANLELTFFDLECFCGGTVDINII